MINIKVKELKNLQQCGREPPMEKFNFFVCRPADGRNHVPMRKFLHVGQQFKPLKFCIYMSQTAYYIDSNYNFSLTIRKLKVHI